MACEQEYWDGTYGTCLPEGWVVVDRETRAQRGVPEEVVVAFQSEQSVSGQFPTVTVTREPLNTVVDPASYSQASVRAVSVLPGYTLLDSQNVTIDDTRVTLHVFIAQPVASEPQRRFYQVSTVSGSAGYTVTGLLPVSIDEEEEEILLVLRNSTFQEPVAEDKEER